MNDRDELDRILDHLDPAGSGGGQSQGGVHVISDSEAAHLRAEAEFGKVYNELSLEQRSALLTGGKTAAEQLRRRADNGATDNAKMMAMNDVEFEAHKRRKSAGRE